MNEQEIRAKISSLKTFWSNRNRGFKDWYEILTLVDVLASRGLESYSSNEPQTFYDMAHFLLTRGELSHLIPIEGESSLEYDRRAKVGRACQYAWNLIDRERQLGGSMAYKDELGFYLLVLGWFASVFLFDVESGILKAQLWNPYDTYPQYLNGKLYTCLHSYQIEEEEARIKAEENNWYYKQRGSPTGLALIDDFWVIKDGIYQNIILINGEAVTSWIERPNMSLVVGTVAGFPDRGSLSHGKSDWKKLAGRSIFEVNKDVYLTFNKLKSMVSQILRDTAQPIMQEFSASPQATVEQLRERGALFHYNQGDQGLVRVPPAAMPIELQAHLMEIRRELQKGSFNDAVWGMVEGQAGYALDRMADASANQILYPYMDAKHLIYEEGDKFWLSKLKTSRRTFDVRGNMVEKLKPTDIPENVSITVESEVATPKDWLERSMIANQLERHLDRDTINSEILRVKDTQLVKRRRSLDKMFEHPVFQTVEMIAAATAHAAYLDKIGDLKQAQIFRKAAMAMEMQLGSPAPGQAKPQEETRVEASKRGRVPERRSGVSPKVAPPETQGFTPAELRDLVGTGRVK